MEHSSSRDTSSPSPSIPNSSSNASSSSGSGFGPQTLRSQILRRPSRFANDRAARIGNLGVSFLDENDGEDDEAPAFLPFTAHSHERARHLDSQLQVRHLETLPPRSHGQITTEAASNFPSRVDHPSHREMSGITSTLNNATPTMTLGPGTFSSTEQNAKVGKDRPRSLAARELSDGTSSASPITSSFSDLDGRPHMGNVFVQAIIEHC